MERRGRYKTCFVPTCTNTTRNSEKIFVTVPAQEDRKRMWFAAVKRDPPVSDTTRFFCCEDHFNLESDMQNYMQYKTIGGNILLKPDVIPHKFICQSTFTSFSTSPKQEQNCLLEEFSEQHSHDTLAANIQITTDTIENIANSSIQNSGISPSKTGSSTLVKIKLLRYSQDIGIQTKVSYSTKATYCNIKKLSKDSASSPFKISTEKGSSPIILPPKRRKIANVQTSDATSSTGNNETYKHTTTDTELKESAEEQEKIMKRERLKMTYTLIKRRPKAYLGIPKLWFLPLIDILKSSSNLSKEDIFLTLMKIKLNDTFLRLGEQFGMSSSNASEIFNKTVPVLDHFLRTLTYWPKKERIQDLLPIPFRAHYSCVQSIINCFEIEIEKLSNPMQQALTWSEYKKCNTIKYLISATPDGFITFISDGYGGRTSDMQLLQNCGFLDVLPEGCIVMADRGFKNIEGVLHQKNCKLIRPPSVPSGTQLSKEQVIETKQIASLRIHIERIIRRVREYALLKPHAVVNHKMIGHIDFVVRIVCALINLQDVVVK